jgi:cation diffusion facilitator CzcD-associated flavoprotein CzcO
VTQRSGGNGWSVDLSSGDRREWSAVVVATGVNWYPNLPAVQGDFGGEQIHSFAFRSPDIFRGKRVLVVGGGNSGADIACEAARHASRAFISLRRGYHFIPKYIFGQPSDVFAHSGPQLPWRIEEKVFGFLLNRLVVGNLENFGLPQPDHPILRSHPVMNTQILHHLGHGDLAYRPDVAGLGGRHVRFVDGREEEIDLIVWATGYQRRFPFLAGVDDSATLDLYLQLFHRAHATLFFMGVFEVDGAAYPLLGLQAELVARYMRARIAGIPAAARFDAERVEARPDLRGGRPYLDSVRHRYYVRGDVYTRALERARDRLNQ